MKASGRHQWIFLALLSWTCLSAAAPAGTVAIGLNKLDLFKQYLGTSSGGDGSEPYVRVTRAMALKAMADAADIGTPFLRVSAPGFSDGDLDLWLRNSEAYWMLFDQMMADLNAHHLKVVLVLMQNALQIPAINRETVREMIRNPNSKSWRMLARYAAELAQRYRDHPAVLFYDLTNELNLRADIDAVARCRETRSGDCGAIDNFSTDDMIKFMARFANVVRKGDPKHPLSSGFAIPRAAAQHLRSHPAWSKSSEAWTKDNEDELRIYLSDVHQSVDLISVHIYPKPDNVCFGGVAPDIIATIKAAADRIGKPLFIGEFGDPHSMDADASFTARALAEIVRLRVPYSSIWVWEFYQRSLLETRTTQADRFSLEPGYTDGLIERIRRTNALLGRFSPSKNAADTRPPRVILTSPLECSMGAGSLQLSAVASDDSGKIDGVRFLVDGDTVAVVPVPPYRVTIERKKRPARIGATACDRSANCATDEVRLANFDVPSDICLSH